MNYSAEPSDTTIPFIAVPVESADSKLLSSKTQHHHHRPAQPTSNEYTVPLLETEFSIPDIILNLALHVLLFIQFGIFFWVHDESVAHLSWTVVNASIVMYLITTYLYRECLHWAGVSYDLSMLLPEVMIVVTMAMCCFYHVLPAFLLLILTKLCLAVIVVVVNAFRLLYEDNDDDADDADADDAAPNAEWSV